MIGNNKAKLLGRVFRYEADFADSGGSIGDRYGGGFSGGEGGGFGGFSGTGPERSDLADLNAGSGASLTGGNLATGGVGFGFAPGPVTNAEAADWADSLAGNTPADAVIVPAAPVKAPTTIGTIVQTGLNILSAVLQIASGSPPAVVNGVRSGVAMAQDAGWFSGSPAPSVVAESGAGSSIGGNSLSGSPAPGGADTGGMAGDAGDTVGSSPVMGFGGVIVGAPQTTTTGAGLGGLSQALAGLFQQPANTRQRYAASVGVQQQQTAPAIPPAVALAGLAGLIFLG